MTCFPDAVQRATAAEAPYSMSSGCATTARAVCQSSGSAVRSLSIPDILSVDPLQDRPGCGEHCDGAGPGGVRVVESVRILQSPKLAVSAVSEPHRAEAEPTCGRNRGSSGCCRA